ncbi:ionotropic glutamate receptor, metazoa, Periplasmic binding protein-like I [Artemisia annua]|uniref:Glutamate receptor n=1 Tax=Artemisia annua TaxID=35608 RepID=A0A2U1N874_ARTAN|nr:ionotropic glutamate receptor, metazoa, Periplasmic binding protein-like I [Artemisia annua]
MHKFNTYLMLSLVVFLFPCLLLQATLTTGSLTTVPEDGNETRIDRIGVIFDKTSRAGKEAKVAIEIAIEDFNNETNQHSVLYYKTSRSKAAHAAIAAKELIDEHKVKAIVGGHTWEEASAIAEAISEANHDHDIPMFLSLATKTPLQEPDQWPFFIKAVPTQSTQITALAAILQSLGMHQVTLIYETSSSASIISNLSRAFRKTSSELTNIYGSQLTKSSSLDEELELLKKQQRKVFVVHTSLELGVRLFQEAKKMEMTGDGYLWITTNQITDLFHSINSTVISSLKGMVGVKTYFPQNNPEFLDFKKRFRQKFQSNYPEEHQDEPGIFALQAYNAAKQLEKYSLESVHQWKPVPATTAEIVYVHGKGYHSVYWTEGSGFSERIEDDISGVKNYTDYMDNVGQALWPVQPWYADRRRRNLAETSKNLMKVGFPAKSLFEQFVKVENDSQTNEPIFSGFVVEVFDEVMRKMNIPYERIPFYGSYDELIKAIPSKFDAVAGDVTIIEERYESVDFTQPYTESGLEIIVPVRSRLSNQAWLFLKPFTGKMWWLIGAVTLYNSFIIWLIERNHNEDLRGSIVTKIGIIIWLAFTTLFTLRGDKLHSNLSRMALVVWLFVALIITQSYTASLASMLTAQRLEPSITSIAMLKNMNAKVGSCNGSFVGEYLTDVLYFPHNKVNNTYNSTQGYAEALNSGEIAAIFLDVPVAKLFLAQYCKSFIRMGETIKVGGFGFAFVRGYDRLSEANRALLNVSENGTLKKLEDTYLKSEKCVDEESSPDKDERLNIHSFWVLFILTGGTSTVAFAFYVIISIREFRRSNQDQIHLLKLISFMKDWKRHMRRSSSIVVNVESARHTRNIDQYQDDIDDS